MNKKDANKIIKEFNALRKQHGKLKDKLWKNPFSEYEKLQNKINDLEGQLADLSEKRKIAISTLLTYNHN